MGRGKTVVSGKVQSKGRKVLCKVVGFPVTFFLFFFFVVVSFLLDSERKSQFKNRHPAHLMVESIFTNCGIQVSLVIWDDSS